jgi:hypothetical protein
MVETQTRRTSGSFVGAAAQSRGFSGHRGAIAQAVAYPPRLTVQTSSQYGRESREAARRRRGAARKFGLKVRGEGAAITAVVACFVLVCALGMAYVGEYALVAQEGRQVHALQGEVIAAQAQHEILVAQYTQLSNGKRVQQLAGQDGMVSSAPSEYITLAASTTGVPGLTEVASAR